MDLNLNIYDCFSSDYKDHHHQQQQHQKLEPGELLEDSWFFGNLLNNNNNNKTKKMSRSFSDPCTTSSTLVNPNQGAGSKSYDETYESIKKLSGDFGRANLLKTPSLPPRMDRRDRTSKGVNSMSDPPRSRTKKLASAGSLHRAPSLPNNLGSTEEGDHDEESDFSMGKLIRQASLNSRSSVNTLPPRTNLAPKGMTPSPTLSRPRSKKIPESQSTPKLESLPEMTTTTTPPPTRTQQRPTHPLKSQKSLSFIESKQLQGLKEQNKPTLSRTMSTFQDKHKMDENHYAYADSLLAKSASPPVPKWGGKKSKEEDVKAQIKFWARAVASNVRQEC